MKALLRSLPFFVLGLLLLGLLAGATGYVLRQLDLLPPTSLSIAAGAPGSAYHDAALAYGRVLDRDGINLQIMETDGSVENAARIGEDAGADIALVQGGIPLGPDIEGLAAVQVEPLWVFARGSVPDDPHLWGPRRVAAGGEGSGTRLVADRIAAITGADSLARGATAPLGGARAAEALLAGDVALALFVAPADAGYLDALLASAELQLMSLAHSEALSLKLPGARLLTLPSGILDYAHSRPPEDVELLALVTRLVARDDLHPALVNRLVHAVLEVHGGRGILPADRDYPASTDLGVPTNGYAAKLLADGFSPLEAYLPYWIVAQFNRVLLVVLPALLLLLPLLRVLPALYGAILSRRVYRHYARVHEIDAELMEHAQTLRVPRLQSLRAELDAIERKLLRANLPNSYRKQAYTLLHHLDYVRKRGDELLRETDA
ncbi:TAXI family TRAP transporter solute-binding subunit [Pseudohaliea sp.]|uniref:TAXI family TRAP transporter solute-binding subunit n=1 Tax=Pseudohaliea sp. TaxID=2740289 RepID=UPI0032EC67F2